MGSVTGFWETLSVVIYFQALAVFIIYTCKTSISASLRERYPILIPMLNIPGKIKSTLYCKESKPLGLSSIESPNKEQEKLMPEIRRE
ncbi:unnamed protein product [Allacma fusca]|uniref:Uncharacterized protein n=1 Tax=Allacma fusca TaxID=39272 RepID=A0A8J2LFN4_9HEXA|nr:unnamed protein product [Allacma fusca]